MSRIAPILVVMAMAGSMFCTDADAQKYYMRQRLSGVVPSAPPPVPNYRYLVREYSGTYSACVNNQMSQEVKVCLRQDGVVVDNSFCSPLVVSCGTVCEPLYQRMWIGNPGATYATGTASSAADAQAWCNANKPWDYRGTCFFDGATGVVTVSKASWMGSGTSQQYANDCR